jgi:hypothetical protein
MILADKPEKKKVKTKSKRARVTDSSDSEDENARIFFIEPHTVVRKSVNGGRNENISACEEGE